MLLKQNKASLSRVNTHHGTENEVESGGLGCMDMRHETHTTSASELDDCGARHEAVYERCVGAQRRLTMTFFSIWTSHTFVDR